MQRRLVEARRDGRTISPLSIEETETLASAARLSAALGEIRGIAADVRISGGGRVIRAASATETDWTMDLVSAYRAEKDMGPENASHHVIGRTAAAAAEGLLSNLRRNIPR
jgi:hypothetical protein